MLSKKYSSTTISRIISFNQSRCFFTPENTLNSKIVIDGYASSIHTDSTSNHQFNIKSYQQRNEAQQQQQQQQQKYNYSSVSAKKLIEEIKKNNETKSNNNNNNIDNNNNNNNRGENFKRPSNRHKSAYDFITDANQKQYSPERLVDKIHRFLVSKLGRKECLDDVDSLLEWYCKLSPDIIDRVRLNLFIQYYSGLEESVDTHHKVMRVFDLFRRFNIEMSVKTYQYMFVYYCRRDRPDERKLLCKLINDMQFNHAESIERMILYDGRNDDLLSSYIWAYTTIGQLDSATRLFDLVDQSRKIRNLAPLALQSLFLHSLTHDFQRAISIMRTYCHNRDTAFWFLQKITPIVFNNIDQQQQQVEQQQQQQQESFNRIVDMVLQWNDEGVANHFNFIEFIKTYSQYDDSISLRCYTQWTSNLQQFPVGQLLMYIYRSSEKSKDRISPELLKHTSQLLKMIVDQKVQLPIESSQALLEILVSSIDVNTAALQQHSDQFDVQRDLELFLQHLAFGVANNHCYDIASLVVYNSFAADKRMLTTLVDFLRTQSPLHTDKISDQVIQVFLHFGQYQHALDWMVRRTSQLHLPRHLLSTANFEIYHHLRIESVKERIAKAEQDIKNLGTTTTIESNNNNFNQHQQYHLSLCEDLKMEERLLQFWRAFNTSSKKTMDRMIQNFVSQRKSSRGQHIHNKLHGTPMPMPNNRSDHFPFKQLINIAVTRDDALRLQSILSELHRECEQTNINNNIGALLLNSHIVLSQILDPLEYIRYRSSLSKDTRILTFHPLPYKNSLIINLDSTFDIMREEQFLLLTSSHTIWNAIVVSLLENGYLEDGLAVAETMLDRFVQLNMRTVDTIACKMLELNRVNDPLLARLPFAERNDGLRNCKLKSLIDANQLDEAERLLSTLNFNQTQTVRLAASLLFSRYPIEEAAQKLFGYSSQLSYRGHFYVEFFEALMTMEVGRNDIAKHYIENVDPSFFSNPRNLNMRLIDLMIRAEPKKEEKLAIFKRLQEQLKSVTQSFWNRIAKINYTVKDTETGHLLGQMYINKEDPSQNDNLTPTQHHHTTTKLSQTNLNFIRNYFQKKSTQQ
ncbi:hypothetical protein PPL_00567 [Heterostelium album PN500]|uniref:Uncharacterized protein n=1 Tax=Heterostelium pallidum (strain ATCC 26659 / Pp 5 / PN500) TaxID=670386 RepID=D3AWT9_HETP5|nr:hypothetical protein PPL_00567 [Heterostelium album PN500]EFA86762.1 hypothetical protein PPL_00567 [Heterostelium album PN500]|eukprot:XP_020438866.1 hypothetical protein PPL_00567 [Heterostelium album PN500]